MSGNCYLHVGAAKTGSTSLQQALSHDLSDERFLYVSGDLPNGSFALTAAYETAPHNEGPFHAANLPGRFDRFRDRQLRLLERGFETARHSGRDLVLSSEETWLWSRPGLIHLREALQRHHFAIQVIVYMRPRVSWIHSLFQQAVKMGGRDLNLPTHRGFRNLRVRNRLELFWDVFGRGQVQVRLFSPADFPGDASSAISANRWGGTSLHSQPGGRMRASTCPPCSCCMRTIVSAGRWGTGTVPFPAVMANSPPE